MYWSNVKGKVVGTLLIEATLQDLATALPNFILVLFC